MNKPRRTMLARFIMAITSAGLVAASQANDALAKLADPTQPVQFSGAGVAVAQKPMGPMLQSTFISASQRRAVISGKSYEVGGKLGGGVITDIQSYEVVLKQAGRETRLRLLPRLVKETSMTKTSAASHEGGDEK